MGSTVQSITQSAEAKLETLRSLSFHDVGAVVARAEEDDEEDQLLDHHQPDDCCFFLRFEESKKTSLLLGAPSPPESEGRPEEMTLHTNKSSGRGGQSRQSKSGQILFSFPNLLCSDGGGRKRNFRRDDEDLCGEGGEKYKDEEEVPPVSIVPRRFLNPKVVEANRVAAVLAGAVGVAVVVVVVVVVVADTVLDKDEEEKDEKKRVVPVATPGEEEKASEHGGITVIVSKSVNKKDRKK
jgi:hypothetical protein